MSAAETSAVQESRRETGVRSQDKRCGVLQWNIMERRLQREAEGTASLRFRRHNSHLHQLHFSCNNF